MPKYVAVVIIVPNSLWNSNCFISCSSLEVPNSRFQAGFTCWQYLSTDYKAVVLQYRRNIVLQSIGVIAKKMRFLPQLFLLLPSIIASEFIQNKGTKKKVKWSCYRPGVAQRAGRGITLLFHDRGTRRGWVVSSTPRPNFTLGKDPVPILQEAGWAPEPVWTGGKSRSHRDSIPDRPPCSQSLCRLSYPAHTK